MLWPESGLHPGDAFMRFFSHKDLCGPAARPAALLPAQSLSAKKRNGHEAEFIQNIRKAELSQGVRPGRVAAAATGRGTVEGGRACQVSGRKQQQ
jgi:hypothetical protein